MPSLPSPKRRPWQPAPPKRVYQPHTERSPLYDSPRWRKLRAALLAHEPCCRECATEGRVTPATVADHVRPYRDGADFYDATNLQPLCASCHARKSAQEGHAPRYRSAAEPEKT